MCTETGQATLTECAERVMEDYRRIAAFIRAQRCDDEDVQREAQSALNHLRIVAGKLAYLAVMIGRDRSEREDS